MFSAASAARHPRILAVHSRNDVHLIGRKERKRVNDKTKIKMKRINLVDVLRVCIRRPCAQSVEWS